MSQMPEGAQLSDDGQWWWDGEQWVAVAEGDAAGGGSAGSASGGEGSDERSAARLEAGLSPTRDGDTPEIFAAFLAEPVCEVEAEGGEELEVLAMNDSESGDGEALA